MLNQIQNFENSNLKSEMRNIVQGSLDKVLGMIEDPSHSAEIRRSSFESALAGIRSGRMVYENDKILPLIEGEISERLQRFKGMSSEEESKLLQLTDEQRRIVSENDRKMKNEFLQAPPHITHGAVKMNDKYRSYMDMVKAATK